MKDSGVEWLGEIPAHWEVTSSGATLLLSHQTWIVRHCQTRLGPLLAQGQDSTRRSGVGELSLD